MPPLPLKNWFGYTSQFLPPHGRLRGIVCLPARDWVVGSGADRAFGPTVKLHVAARTN